MPKQKDLKRLVRSRMQKTGESYTTARMQLQKKKRAKLAPAEYSKLAGMSDASVEKATGCNWERWVFALDTVGAREMPHKEIAKLVAKKWQVGAWWAQMVTVGYERIRGLRDKGQRRGGGYVLNKSKTIAVPLHTLYRAFATKPARRRWLGDVDVKVKTSTVDKSIRFLWEDGSPFEVNFWEKGPAKSQVQLQHGGFPTKEMSEQQRAFWTERLAELAKLLA